jgi:hypothetical protein
MLSILAVLVRTAVPPITNRWAPRGINTQWPGLQRSPLLPKRFNLTRNISELISLSSIVALQAPKPIIDLHHQNLRENAANFDWRADSLIPKVKRAFDLRLADILEFITLGALLLAG